MTRLTTSQIRKELSETINRVSFGHERIILHRHGKDIAALIPIEDLKILEEILDRLDVSEAMAAIEEAEREGTISLDELGKELGIK
jgi:prevent-host-death family protein